MKHPLFFRFPSRSHCFGRLQCVAFGFAVAGTLALGTVSSRAATIPLVLNGVNWGTNYYHPHQEVGAQYDGTPNATTRTSPVWDRTGTSTKSTLGDHFFRLETAAEETLHYRQFNALDGSDVATVEFTMRVVSYIAEENPYAAHVLLGNGSEYISIGLGTEQFSFGGQVVPGDFTEMTTFRITLEHMETTPTATLYVNHSPVPVVVSTSFTTGNLNYIRFGDASSSALGQGGITEWEAIRWTTTGAFAPIPEPSAAVFGLFGALLFFGSRKSWSRWSGKVDC